jgi:hypothetical protein
MNLVAMLMMLIMKCMVAASDAMIISRSRYALLWLTFHSRVNYPSSGLVLPHLQAGDLMVVVTHPVEYAQAPLLLLVVDVLAIAIAILPVVVHLSVVIAAIALGAQSAGRMMMTASAVRGLLIEIGVVVPFLPMVTNVIAKVTDSRHRLHFLFVLTL